ncbi:Mth938-like domain-containing protein [Chloroflexota bacterium]
MNIIDSYRFGQIVISGQEYSLDVIIFPDRVQGSWHRNKSHELLLKDISGVLAGNPEVMVVGTGASGQMRVLPEVQQELEARGIKLIVESTNEACDIYNQLSPAQRVVAALHLTC